MKVQAYLAFRGNCQQALEYYSEILNADIINRQTYYDNDTNVPSSFGHKLQHAELKGRHLLLMAYDISANTPLKPGNQIHMSAELNDMEEAAHVFSELSSGGQVHHTFMEWEWGYFGRCTDKFGINWMVKCNHQLSIPSNYIM
ncbi:PhnB protein [Gelidibacter algens]|jgi:PhnB protein|uniref:PhnB protein n=1 Tax=Gelidibacter algens TaxID=49280 RepID=A0A1A7R183_9FLAO|nr:VOC family protein [Gelidibacter algens]OBX26015.1 hypothetical protein A9996_06790 [Gelidibacter algens]RAJ27719.1 PhnB protein [Gelidibacter algens]